MTHEEKINYMRIASNICTFGFKEDQMDLLVSIYDAVLEKHGDLNVHDIVKIEFEVKSRADAKSRGNLLDKVSKKKYCLSCI